MTSEKKNKHPETILEIIPPRTLTASTVAKPPGNRSLNSCLPDEQTLGFTNTQNAIPSRNLNLRSLEKASEADIFRNSYHSRGMDQDSLYPRPTESVFMWTVNQEWFLYF